MIYPMMLKVDFTSIRNAGKKPKGLVVTLVVNWLIKPFTMYALAWFFLKVVFKALIPSGLATEYLAGAVLLGAAPCTAMVFVWSYLSDGDAGYTVIQVAINDLVILVAFTPIVAFLLGISDVRVPWDTLILSVVLFVVIPLSAGALTRSRLIKNRGKEWFENVFLKKFDGITEFGLLLTLVILFAFQGETILKNPLDIVLIAIPLVIQTYLIFAIGYGWAKSMEDSIRGCRACRYDWRFQLLRTFRSGGDQSFWLDFGCCSRHHRRRPHRSTGYAYPCFLCKKNKTLVPERNYLTYQDMDTGHECSHCAVSTPKRAIMPELPA